VVKRRRELICHPESVLVRFASNKALYASMQHSQLTHMMRWVQGAGVRAAGGGGGASELLGRALAHQWALGCGAVPLRGNGRRPAGQQGR
jgi:hypothetical protein